MQADWQHWVGREENARDRLTPALLLRYDALFSDYDGPGRPGLHWGLCQPAVPVDALGEDGHPLRDASSFLPPVPLPRRMWVGSAIVWHSADPVTNGALIERQSRIAAVTEKSGQSGALCFVDAAHHWTVAGEPWLDEVQTLVFRAGANMGAGAGTPPPLPVDGGIDVPLADWLARYCPEERLLFRYSAFMGNGHRIHYDAPYAIAVEGYPALVVHGPLLASWLMQAAVDALGPLARFSFRAHSPAFCGQDVALVRGSAQGERAPGDLHLECRGNDGRLCISASASAQKA